MLDAGTYSGGGHILFTLMSAPLVFSMIWQWGHSCISAKLFLRRGTVESLLKKNEHRTSNIECWMGKDEETEIGVECSVLAVSFSFDVGRSMFDVHLSRL